MYVLESIDLITRTYETSGEDSLVVTKMPPRHVLSLLIDIDAHQCCDCSHQFKALRDYLALKSDSFKKVSTSIFFKLIFIVIFNELFYD